LAKPDEASATSAITLQATLGELASEALERQTGLVLTIDELLLVPREHATVFGAALQRAIGANGPIVVAAAGLPAMRDPDRLPTYFERAEWHHLGALDRAATLHALMSPAAQAGRVTGPDARGVDLRESGEQFLELVAEAVGDACCPGEGKRGAVVDELPAAERRAGYQGVAEGRDLVGERDVHGRRPDDGDLVAQETLARGVLRDVLVFGERGDHVCHVVAKGGAQVVDGSRRVLGDVVQQADELGDLVATAVAEDVGDRLRVRDALPGACRDAVVGIEQELDGVRSADTELERGHVRSVARVVA
jgi:hypothetical protein